MKLLSVFDRAVFIKDVVIASVIVMLPFLFYLYELVPDSEIWENKYFTIEFDYFENANYFAWILSTKLLTAGVLYIWFLTCKHWWRFAILVPIVIENFKLFGLIEEEFFSYQTKLVTFLKTLPISLIIIVLLIFISRKLNYFDLIKSLKNEINSEINVFVNSVSKFKTSDFKKIKNKLIEIRSVKHLMSKKEYLNEITRIRESLINLENK